MGVEEELLVVDPVDAGPAPAGEEIIDAADRIRERTGGTDLPPFEREFKREQAELGSAPCTEMSELHGQLAGLRSEMMTAAVSRGARVAALATSPFKVRPTPTDNERYAAMGEEFGLLARQQLTCGQHVHVSIASRAEGVAVLDRIRPWLAVLTALSSNSPYWQGQDSGYASFRTVMWGLWPTAGPTEAFGDVAGYDGTIADLIASGAAMDDGMIYFDARLSASYPTVEIRVADVCLAVEDAVVIAALCRALVDTAAADLARDRTAPRIRVGLLQAASWRAARSGMAGDLVDVGRARSVPAWNLVDQLIDQVGPALRTNGDLGRTEDALAAIRSRGTGAHRQRQFFAAGGLEAVVHDAVRATVAGSSAGTTESST